MFRAAKNTLFAGSVLGLVALGCEGRGALLEANLWDEGRQCFEVTSRPVGNSRSSYCLREPIVAVDEKGNCWSFPNSCLPDGFTRAVGHPCYDNRGYCEHTVVHAHPWNESRQCFELWTRMVGRLPGIVKCVEEPIPAVDADGDCWVSANHCLPDDFDHAKEDGRCGEKYNDEGFCEDIRQPIRALRWNESQECFEREEEEVGYLLGDLYLKRDEICTETEMYAIDSNGECWLFGDGGNCFPDGFKPAEGNESCYHQTRICEEGTPYRAD